MPVVLGENLTLEENKLSAVYKELYTKLNKAYAWTNTQTTSSNGSAVLIYNNQIYDTKDCDDINLIYSYTSDNGGNKLCIISGKLYYCNNGLLKQIGNKENWKICGESKNSISYYYAIDINNNLFYIDEYENLETQIGNNINWTQLATVNDDGFAIGDGKLYHLYRTEYSQIGDENSWTKIIYAATCYGICNGYVHYITNDQTYPCANVNNIIDISAGYIKSWEPYYSYAGLALGSDGKLYRIGLKNDKSINLDLISNAPSNITKIYVGSATWLIGIIIADGKLYRIYAGDNEDSNNVKINLVDSLHIWSDGVSGYSGEIIAIGDGKLYYNDGGTDLIQIGEDNNYQKIVGACYSEDFAIAWSGNSLSTSYTVYSTKNPHIDDILYQNENLVHYSSCKSINGNTITDEYRTYERDGSRDKSFSSIPPATIHENIKVSDILIATNPNN